MNIEPNMSSAAMQSKVAARLRDEGFQVRPHAGRLAFPFPLRVTVDAADEARVWNLVHEIDPAADQVSPPSAFATE